MIQKETIKIGLFYLISVGFILLNIFFVVKKDLLIINALPFLLGILLLVIYSFDKLIYLIIFFTPLSIPLRELKPDLSFDMYLPTEPLLFLVLILFILKMVNERDFDKSIITHPVSLVVFLNLFWILVTCFTSTMPVISIKFFLVRVWFVVVLYLLAVKIFSQKITIEQYIWLYVIPFIIVIFYSIYRHTGYGLFDRYAAHFVVTPFYNDHTSYGAALAIYLPFIALFSFGKTYSKRFRFISLIVLLVFIAGIILSYSRAAWVSILAAFIVWTVIKLKIPLKSIVLSLIIVFGLLTLSQDQILLRLQKNSVESSSNLVEHVYSISNITSDASNLERINRWNCALRMFRDKPLMGFGPGTYMFKYASYQLNKNRTIISTNAGDLGNAHSEYLGALSESGIPGLITFLLIITTVLYTAIKTYKRVNDKRLKSLILAAITGLVTYYIHGFLNNFLDTDKLSVPFWGFTGIIVAIDLYSRNKFQNNPGLQGEL
ncbi:MAG: O-antigen ligase family protein [Prolixibacteraceae bacterium]|nr:O-antigen ligase family protein [Prolixibacteraceae bacterium]